MKLNEFAFRAILSVASASLGINSYFVKSKVDEISADIRSLSVSYQQLRVENASRDATLNTLRSRLEVTEIRNQSIEERLRALEVRLGR